MKEQKSFIEDNYEVDYNSTGSRNLKEKVKKNYTPYIVGGIVVLLTLLAIVIF